MEDTNIAELIYGSPTPILKVESTKVKPKGAKIKRILLTLTIYHHHKDIKLYIDLCFVNSYPFLEKNQPR